MPNRFAFLQVPMDVMDAAVRAKVPKIGSILKKMMTFAVKEGLAFAIEAFPPANFPIFSNYSFSALLFYGIISSKTIKAVED